MPTTIYKVDFRQKLIENVSFETNTEDIMNLLFFQRNRVNEVISHYTTKKEQYFALDICETEEEYIYLRIGKLTSDLDDIKTNHKKNQKLRIYYLFKKEKKKQLKKEFKSFCYNNYKKIEKYIGLNKKKNSKILSFLTMLQMCIN